MRSADVWKTVPNITLRIMAGYFQSVPAELEEAARIDGASRFQSFIRIALPSPRHSLAATAIFTLLNWWDAFFFALVFTSTYATKTVPVAIAEFIGRHSVDWGLLCDGRLYRQPAAAHHLAAILPLYRVRPRGRWA